MKNLVEVKKGEPYAASDLVARKFGVKHNDLVKIIENVFNDYPDLRGGSNTPKTIEKYFTEEHTYKKSVPYTAYIMNKPFFTLVAMRMTSKRARTWQREFNTAFHVMDRIQEQSKLNTNDPLWLDTQAETRPDRKTETDIINEFIQYAKDQGGSPKGCDNYFGNLTRMANDALFDVKQQPKNLRKVLKKPELRIAQQADIIISKAVADGMDQEMYYKDIFQLAKKNVHAYAEVRGKSRLSYLEN